MSSVEAHSDISIQDAVSRALAAAHSKKDSDDARIEVSVSSTWEDDTGFHATVSVHHHPLSDDEKALAPGETMAHHPQDREADDLFDDILEHEAEEFMAIFFPDVATQYRRPDEDTVTMLPEPRLEEMHKKLEYDFDYAEFPDYKHEIDRGSLNHEATHLEIHPEGTTEEED